MITGAAPGSLPRDGMDLLSSYFLGPKAQNAKLWEDMLGRVYDDYVHWRRNYFPEDNSFIGRNGQRETAQLEWLDQLSSDLDEVLDKLKADYPFYSPRYIAHMTSDQTLPSVLGFFAGILYNPNNVTDEAAPVTVELELKVASLLATMLGLADRSKESDEGPWGHLTSGGTIATLEALWVARQAQFVPLVVADLCEHETARDKAMDKLAKRGRRLSKEVEKVIKSGVWGEFLDQRLGGGGCRMSDRLSLGPDTQLSLLRDLRSYLDFRLPPGERASGAVSREFTDFILAAVRRSRYNPARAGYASVLAEVNRVSGTHLAKGVVFASEAAHYCLAKACNVLGYGSKGLRRVPLDDGFRISVDALEREFEKLKSDEYVAAVVTILGTTEEGAVDPVDRVVALRERDKSRSFWLHADAAWGGYVACVFDRDESGDLLRTPTSGARARRGGELTVNGGAGVSRRVWTRREDLPGRDARTTVIWGGPNGAQDHVMRAFGAVSRCDSVVVDPHKLGYVPYPSGTIVFRDGRTKLLTTQTASYIGAGEGDGPDPLVTGTATPATSVGEYSLEGSKPGATATAAWLAHRSIPLTDNRHGRIIDQTLLSAQKLAHLLRVHGEGSGVAESRGKSGDNQRYGIGFRLVAEPDTNVVTFIAQPLRRTKAGTQRSVPWTLPELNALNRAIHARMGVPQRPDQAKALLPAGAAPPYGHPFFVSKTKIVSRHQPEGTYSFRSVSALLDDLLPSKPSPKKAYNREPDGLIALRCTVMSPYYELAEADGTDYIVDFVRTLHDVAADVLERFERLASYALVEVEEGTAHAVARAIQVRSTSVRRALVVEEIEHGRLEKVLIEVRAPLDREEDLAGEMRQLGSDYAVKGVIHTETFIRTEGHLTGEPAIDSRPVVFVFLAVEVGSTRAVYEHVKGVSISKGGLEARIVTGRYDVAVSVSGMSEEDAKGVVEAITSDSSVQEKVRSSEVLWVTTASTCPRNGSGLIT
jgi:glutamate/tyrosine decarboxylase-like PLP-dependent enzyme